MTVDEAIRDLLNISTDVRRVVVLGPGGELLGAGPGAVGAEVGEAARPPVGSGRAPRLLARRPPLEHVIVAGRRSVASRSCGRDRRSPPSPAHDPALGLLLFDLRTCLADAFGEATS